MNPPGRRWLAAIVFLVAAAPASAGAPAEGVRRTSAWTWEEVPRVVALGDTHGAVGKVEELLLGLGLADEDLHWTGGGTHLVFVGDLVDRGTGERALLDLVRRLQVEARKAGGRVHVLLGNHEVMNMMQDLRYVTGEGYRQFQDLEKNGMRRKAFERFSRRSLGENHALPEVKELFDEQYPPGYFGRRAAFGPGGLYSEWLLDQQVAIRVNGFVFVHAGLVEEVAALGFEGIRSSVITAVREYWRLRGRLIDVGKVTPSDDFGRTMRIAAEILSGDAGEEEKQAAGDLRRLLASPAVSSDGPLWYRGNAREPERVERERVEESLELLGGKALVVGHSITRRGMITSRFGGRVIRADVGMAYSEASGPQALVIEDGVPRVFEARTGTMAALAAEPPEGEGALIEASQLTDLALENLLETGEPVSARPLGKGSTRPFLIEIRIGGTRARGVCKYVETARDRYQHEIAAYRLDRSLGLGLVPVTVLRTTGIDRPCAMQYFVEHALDAQAVAEYGLPSSHAESVRLQLMDGQAFDALIGNGDRTESDILHLPEEGRIALVDHSRAFSRKTGIGDWYPEGKCVLSPGMSAALERLDRKTLDSVLTGWVEKKRIDAVMKRRDELLAKCTQAGP